MINLRDKEPKCYKMWEDLGYKILVNNIAGITFSKKIVKYRKNKKGSKPLGYRHFEFDNLNKLYSIYDDTSNNDISQQEQLAINQTILDYEWSKN